MAAVSGVEVFLDDTPGETRGALFRNGRPERLIIQRDDDVAAHRLGARSVGRVARIEPALKGAFVDLGVGAPFGFLPGKGVDEGARVQVEVTAEPRDGKGPALRLTGPGDGEARLLAAGPDVRAVLSGWAPSVEPVEGVDAIQAVREAEEEALGTGVVLESVGLDLRIERTRAMTVVDLDWAPATHLHGAQARARANDRGIAEAARLIRLRSWGGLASIDLIGTGFDGDRIAASARTAFEDEAGLVVGPVNRFGVLMLSRAWRRRPIDDILLDGDGRRSLRTRAADIVRALRFALLSERGAPTITARCISQEAERAAPWVAALGPRARLVADDGIAAGHFKLEEG